MTTIKGNFGNPRSEAIREEIYRGILKMIMTNELRHGQRLIEDALVILGYVLGAVVEFRQAPCTTSAEPNQQREELPADSGQAPHRTRSFF